MHARKSFIGEMFRAGAKGYLLKDCEFDELARAVRVVAEGKAYISPAITDVVIDGYTHQPNGMEYTVFSVLTPREREVLQLLAEGNSTKQIGQRLFISPKTVEVHRLKIMDKLNLNNVAQLTKYAIQEGLTSPEP
jgi:DNA-binding NarL/FixJ family response regulator